MIKKLVAIGLIIVAVAMVVIVLIGLFTQHNGRFGWQSIVDAWEGRTSHQQTTIATTENTTPAATQNTENTTPAATQNTATNTTPATTPAPTPATTPKTTTKTNTTTNTTVPDPTPNPIPNPNPTPTCKAGGACTAAQVATHTSQSDCWVIYGSKVYNVTAYIPDHNGGTKVFTTSVCGHDITSYMNGAASAAGRTHTHSSAAYTVLNSYWYANLV